MMLLVAALFTLLPLLAAATPIKPRAGGPTLKPIPPTCTLTNPLPHSNCTLTTIINGLKPNSNFTAAHTLYSAYFDLPTPTEELWEQCSQQCYGYGDGGECKSAVLAHEVPVPERYYGGDARKLMIACLLFDEFLAASEFEEAVEGQWVDIRAGNLRCGT